MINVPFFTGMWVAFLITVFGSFFVFFSKQFRSFALGCALTLSGITIQLLNFDMFREQQEFLNFDIPQKMPYGQIIAAALWILLLIQLAFFKYALTTKSKINKAFFALPFLAFVATAISLDLLSLAFGLSLFGITFAVFAALKGQKKEKLFIAIQKIGLAFLTFAYGTAILFTREGTAHFSFLKKELLFKASSKDGLDEWTILGIGLIGLAVIIELYAIIPLIGKKNEKV